MGEGDFDQGNWQAVFGPVEPPTSDTESSSNTTFMSLPMLWVSPMLLVTQHPCCGEDFLYAAAFELPMLLQITPVKIY